MRSRSLSASSWLAGAILVAGLIAPGTAAAHAGPAGSCDPADPAACLLPFPNDYFTTSDPRTTTGIRIDLKRDAMPRNALGTAIDPAEWNRNDGFSPGAMLLTHVPGLDLAATGAAPVTDIGRSLADDAPIVLINTRTGQRHPYWAELDANADDPARRALIIRPARNFDESARFVVALRNMRDAGGNPLAPNPVYASLMQLTPPADAQLHRRWQYAQRALGSLRSAHVDLGGLYLAWDFTVASQRNLTERVLHMRDEAFAHLGSRSPVFTVDSVTDYPADQDPLIARQVKGTVFVPSYLDTPLGLPGSRLHYDRDGLPGQVLVNTQLARFICDIPRTASGTAPAHPALYGHGLLGDPSEIDSGALKKYMSESNTMLCATPWIGMAQEDIPVVLAALADVSLFPAVPDRTQQGFLDFLFLGRAMAHPRGLAARTAFQGPDGRPLIATGHGALEYMGNSQGGILGGALTAIAQDFTYAVLGVPAANYSTLLNRSADFDQFRTVFDPAYPDKLDQQLVFTLMQMLWDRGEADGYAAHITGNPLPRTPDHRALLIEAFGDHQVANIATEVQARTMGIPVRQPALAPGRSPDVTPFWGMPAIPSYPYAGSALVMVDSGTPPPPPVNLPNRAGADPHSHPRNAPGIRSMAAQFLATGTVVDTCDGQPCTAPPL
jgi:hypothetical protein